MNRSKAAVRSCSPAGASRSRCQPKLAQCATTITHAGVEGPAQAQGVAQLLLVGRAGRVLQARVADQRQVDLGQRACRRRHTTAMPGSIPIELGKPLHRARPGLDGLVQALHGSRVDTGESTRRRSVRGAAAARAQNVGVRCVERRQLRLLDAAPRRRSDRRPSSSNFPLRDWPAAGSARSLAT